MKSTITSFLFFCITLLVTNQSNAQAIDSLGHYSRLVKEPKKPDDLAKAFKFFTEEKLKHSTNEKNLLHEIYATQYLAEIQRKLGYVSENEKLILESLRLLEKIDEKTNWTHINYTRAINELGKIYREKRDYKRALALYDEALSAAETPNHKAVLYNNKGKVYEFKKELETALYFYEASYKNALEAENPKHIARALSNKSLIESKLGKPDALSGLKEAMDIREANNYTYDLGSSLDGLVHFYLNLNDTITAKKYSNDFMQLAKKTGIVEQLLNALRLKIETGESQYAMKYVKLNDSINSVKEEKRNNFNYYVYQYDKKEKDLKESQLYNERLLYLLLFIALASLSIYFILKYKHKKEKLQEIYNTETRISRKIHDEVANDVYHVMTQLQTNSSSEKELLDNLENIYRRTRDISKQNSSIDLKVAYGDLLNDLFLSYKDDNVNIITKGLQQIHWEQLKEIQKSTIYRVLQELLTNMRKHSHASIVVLSFDQSGTSLIINYKDNGQGTAIIKGNGLQNTENRIHSIKGTITFESEIDKGFKATITI